MKRLHVTPVTLLQLAEHGWPMYPFAVKNLYRGLYIRCSQRGKVNWDIAPVYTADELIERDNVRIVKIKNHV